MTVPRKPGRPSKGERKPYLIKMPVLLAAELEAEARRNGLDVTTWVTQLVADRLEFPLTRQEQLPLTDVA
jgi:hypothetical protein